MTGRGASDDADRPEVYEATLDIDSIEALFRDLTSLAEIEHVRVKGAGGPHDDRSTTLAEARESLLRGNARAVRIRYRHEGENWCDTLMSRGESVHLVRLREQPPRVD